MTLDFADYCKGCGTKLPQDRYATRRDYCSYACYMREYREIEKAARLEAKANRPPCVWCGGPVAIKKDRRAVYCSLHCQKQANHQIRETRNALTCPNCGKDFRGRDGQTYCCQWCRSQVELRKHQPRACQWCDAMIQNPKRAATKYCCSTCAARAREAARRTKNET